MTIDIFSDCAFTRGAFEFIEHEQGADKHIAVFDVGLSVGDYHSHVAENAYDLVIVLNARKHTAVAISDGIVLLSKYTPISIIKKIINLYLSERCTLGPIILTSRERVCFKYWFEGRTTAAIASEMNESIKAVSNIKQSIYRKYDTSDLYTFVLIMKASQMTGRVRCRHYKLFGGVEIKKHTRKWL